MAAQPIRQTAPPMRVAYNRAFTECCQIVQEALKQTGIRWTAEAEQAAACTLFIAADKHGYLDMWESPAESRPPAPIHAMPDPAESRPPAPINAMPDPLAGRREARSTPARPSDDLLPTLARSIEAAKLRQSAPSPDSANGAAKAEPWFPVMLRAFREIEQDVPPEIFTAVLEWYGANSPESFTPDRQTQAIGCYVALKQAREDYRRRCADPTSFENFAASEGL